MFKKVILGLSVTVCTFLGGCFPTEDKETEEFLNKIESAFQLGRSEVPLRDITNFEWDEVCLFVGDDSAPLTTEVFSKFLKSRKIPDEHNLVGSSHAIIAFLNGKKIKTVKQFKHISLNSEKYHLAVQNDDDSRFYDCTKTKDASLVRVDSSKNIFLKGSN